MPERIADRKTTEELLRQLVRIPSPYFHEDAVMDFVLDWLRGEISAWKQKQSTEE